MKIEIPPSVSKQTPYFISFDTGVQYLDESSIGSSQPPNPGFDEQTVMKSIENSPNDSRSREMYNRAFRAAYELDLSTDATDISPDEKPSRSLLDDIRLLVDEIDIEFLMSVPKTLYVAILATFMIIFAVGFMLGPREAVGVLIGVTGLGLLIVMRFLDERESDPPLASKLLAVLFVIVGVDLILNLGVV